MKSFSTFVKEAHVYGDDVGTGRGYGGQSYHSMDATKHWARHYDNHLYLDFIHKHDKDPKSRAQARKEMDIAQKKMDHWKRHPNWDRDKAHDYATKAKQKWSK